MPAVGTCWPCPHAISTTPGQNHPFSDMLIGLGLIVAKLPFPIKAVTM